MPTFRSDKETAGFRYQQALRMASRGPNAVYLHLLLPLSLLLGFVMFVAIPLIIVWVAPVALSAIVMPYLDWCLIAWMASSPVIQYWGRKWLLRPYIEQLMRQNSDNNPLNNLQ